MEIKYYKQALSDIKDLTDKNKEITEILKRGIWNLKRINFDKSLLNKTIKPLKGYKNVQKKLSERGFIPNIFEFRKFTKKYPFRIIFLIREDKTEY